MSLGHIVFAALALLAVCGAWRMITSHHPVHSALYLVLNFVATAGMYLLLGAPFIAIIQVAVYAGAIMVLFLFIIMYLNLGLARDILDDLPRRRLVGTTAALLGLLSGSLAMHGLTKLVAQESMPSKVEDIGVTLFGTYALPFEVASLLLLVAMAGVLVIARPHMTAETQPAETQEAQS